MRIIAGKFGGRTFNSPRGHKTHPMSEKIRGALFNALGDIEGLTILDAFSGSGAIAFEAISRGAKSVIAIDSSKEAVSAIKESTAQLAVQQSISVVQATCLQWSSTNSDKQFDIVICDPPYDDLQQNSLTAMYRHIREGGLFILSIPPNAEIGSYEDSEELLRKDYGDAHIIFLRRKTQ